MVGDVAAHVGVAAVEVGDGAHPHGVVVPAGEQRGPGRRAQRGDVEIGVAQPLRGQTVDVRRGQLGAVAAEVGEPGVVEEDEHHVGRVLAGVGRGRPPRGRFGLGAGDHAVEAVVGLHGGPLVGGRRTAGATGTGGPQSVRAALGRQVPSSGHREWHCPPWRYCRGSVEVGHQIRRGPAPAAVDDGHPWRVPTDDGWRRRTSPSRRPTRPGGGAGSGRRPRVLGRRPERGAGRGRHLWLAYRLRRPLGAGRGYANVVARSEDGENFETVTVLAGRSSTATRSSVRPWYGLADGAWRLYVSCATPGTRHWRVDALDADRPASFIPRSAPTVFAGDASTWG